MKIIKSASIFLTVIFLFLRSYAYSQSTVDTIWQDKNRNSSIPIKFYIPQDNQLHHPCVIMSHGLGGTYDSANLLCNYLAQNGYFCVSVEHPQSDRKYIQNLKRNGVKIFQEIKNMSSEQLFNQMKIRCEDIEFVLDNLIKLNSDSQSKLYQQIDTNLIAMAGHSFGSGTTLALAGQNFILPDKIYNLADSRFKAFICLSVAVNGGDNPTKEIYKNISGPIIFFTGTRDNQPFTSQGAQIRRVVFDSLNIKSKYLVIFDGGTHMDMSCSQGYALNNKASQNIADMIENVSLKFLDAYLLNSKSARSWLKNDCQQYLKNSATFEF